MRTIARVLFYDVLLGLVYIASDAFLAYFYFSNGHPWWGALTLGAVALPGTLGGVNFQNGKNLNILCFRMPELHLLPPPW